MQLTIAPAADQERDWSARLMAGSEPWLRLGRGLEQCRSACSHPEYLLYIARSGAEPCGFILLHPRGLAGSPYIASVAVAEEMRGRGIGSRLLAYAEDRFAAAGQRHIFLCVSSFNARAQRLYEARGYRAVGELKDYIIEGASEILMHKRLERR